ncbi:hypothetical protein RUM43_009150 [Polyplax serrata]|uniref:Centromere protein I n=1 Tax=Polyplax serrata TaxID=468196 RepID=A0AAN8S1W1_POLSC
MTSDRQNAIQCILQTTGGKHISRNFQASIDELKKLTHSEGLSENELELLCNYLITTKLTNAIRGNLMACFVPENSISEKLITKLMLWFFTERGQNNITTSLEKQFINWLIGIVYYDLIDGNVLDSYYYSFIFLLDVPHLESPVCKLLCLLTKPEDATRWVVLQILRVHNRNGQKMHTNSVLSLLKSYRPEVVPERVPVTNFTPGSLGIYEEPLKQAHARKLNISTEKDTKKELKWNSWQMYDNKKAIARIIPAPENLNLDSGIEHNEQKKYSVIDLKCLSSVAVHHLRIEYPAQTLSLLANTGGHHLLAFSDDVTKARFSHKLYHTLWKVFLLELLPYTEKEKLNFLKLLKEFHEYMNQSVPVVSTFLFNYLLVWDGDSYKEEILGLIEWIEVRNEEDLQKYVFSPLQQIFLSSGTHTKCLIIQTMGKLLRNLLVKEKREKNYFQTEYEECDLVKSIEAITNFVGGLIRCGLIWNNETRSRNILMSALDFYEITQALEQARDLPIIIVMPPSLVYTCLFSGSRVCIARMCSLLVRLQMTSVERLFLLGVYEDFSEAVQQLNTYVLDYYRCLWSHVLFQKNEESYLFHENIFSDIFWKYKENFGDIMEKIFGVECNSTFWVPQNNGNFLRDLADDFPSIVILKQVVEDRILRRETGQ